MVRLRRSVMWREGLKSIWRKWPNNGEMPTGFDTYRHVLVSGIRR